MIDAVNTKPAFSALKIRRLVKKLKRQRNRSAIPVYADNRHALWADHGNELTTSESGVRLTAQDKRAGR